MISPKANRIRVLPDNVASLIAAGEVVERPSSVIKELIENALDAQATAVVIDIEDGGVKRIKVTDNGLGIIKDDLRLAVTKHATSKLFSIADMSTIYSMGFRGEALASVAAVALLKVRSRYRGSEAGAEIAVRGGAVQYEKELGCPEGTTVTVESLFFNVPARLKYLGRHSNEAARVTDIVGRLALAHPEVAIKYTSNGELLLHTAGNGSLADVIGAIYGAEQKRQISEVSYELSDIKIKGYISKPAFTYKSTRGQSVFVNSRYIKSELVQKAVLKAYGERLLKGEYPFFALNIELPFSDVDVNVHPNKLTVHFKDEQKLEYTVINAVRGALEAANPTPSMQLKQTFTPPPAPPVRERSTLDEVISAAGRVDHAAGAEAPIRNASAPPAAKAEKPKPDIDEAKKELERARALLSQRDEQQPQILRQFPSFAKKDDAKSVYHADLSDGAQEKPQPATLPFIGKDSKPYKLKGSLFDTYILAESGDTVYIIDQHAAHERLVYETIKKSVLEKKPLSQPLLAGATLTLTHEELLLLKDNRQLVEALGIELSFGRGLTVTIKAIPVILGETNVRTLMDELLTELKDGGEIILRQDRLIKASCRGAIKGGQKLTDEQLRQIVRELVNMDSIPNCPHGRPIAVALTKAELEKSFRRIV